MGCHAPVFLHLMFNLIDLVGKRLPAVVHFGDLDVLSAHGLFQLLQRTHAVAHQPHQLLGQKRDHLLARFHLLLDARVRLQDCAVLLRHAGHELLEQNGNVAGVGTVLLRRHRVPLQLVYPLIHFYS